MRSHGKCAALALALALLALGTARAGAEGTWREIEPGLDLAAIRLPEAAPQGVHPLRVLRVDPGRFALRLLCAGREGGPWRTVEEWAGEFGLAAAVNASMFLPGGRSTGYMRTGDYVNSARANPAFGAVLLGGGRASVRLLTDRRTRWREAARDCAVVVQNYRVVADGAVVWGASKKRHSTALVGLDGRGRMLFIHCRAPYPVRRLAAMLLALPLDLRQAMYLEGGPEASLFVAGAGGGTYVGSWEDGFNENDANRRAWPLPNVLGVVRRAP